MHVGEGNAEAFQIPARRRRRNFRDFGGIRDPATPTETAEQETLLLSRQDIHAQRIAERAQFINKYSTISELSDFDDHCQYSRQSMPGISANIGYCENSGFR